MIEASENPPQTGIGNVFTGPIQFDRSKRRRPLRWVRRWTRLRGEQGSATLEFALAAPVLFAFFFGLIEVSMALYTHQMISETAREGTRYAMVHGATCLNGSGGSCTVSASNVNSYVSSIPWPNIGGGSTAVNTTYPDGNQNPGSRVQVVITYAFPFNVPFVPKTTLTMSSTSVMYIVQ